MIASPDNGARRGCLIDGHESMTPDGWMLAIEPVILEMAEVEQVEQVEQLRSRVTSLVAGLRAVTLTLEDITHAGILYDQEWRTLVREAAIAARRLAGTP